MPSTPSALDRLSKVLALADSNQEGEALAALRAARSLLHGDGVSLSEVLRTALEERGPEFVKARGVIVASLQREVLSLQAQVKDLQFQLREKQQEINHWRRAAERIKPL